MPKKAPDAVTADTPAAHQHLRLLFVLRNISLGGQLAAFAIGIFYLDLPLPYIPALVVIGLMVVFNIWTRYRLSRQVTISEIELFVQLCVDVLELSVLLYLAGGATNPFTALYLLPITISSTILRSRYTWMLVALTVLCYTLLIPFNIPLPMAHDMHAVQDDFNMHVLGMWLGFIISAGVVAFFVVRMGQSLRRQEKLINRQRVIAARNERLLALGTQAATTAHELGTPLQTISLLVAELRESCAGDDETSGLLTTLGSQVDRCKHALAELAASAGNPAASAGGLMPVDDFLNDWLGRWREKNTQVRLRIDDAGNCGQGVLLVDRVLSQALDNLLDNAARACSRAVELSFSCDERFLSIVLADDGPGLAPEMAQLVGQEPVITEDGGMGIGLFLARAVIERFGGRVIFSERRGGGTRAEVSLPLQAVSTTQATDR